MTATRAVPGRSGSSSGAVGSHASPSSSHSAGQPAQQVRAPGGQPPPPAGVESGRPCRRRPAEQLHHLVPHDVGDHARHGGRVGRTPGQDEPVGVRGVEEPLPEVVVHAPTLAPHPAGALNGGCGSVQPAVGQDGVVIRDAVAPTPAAVQRSTRRTSGTPRSPSRASRRRRRRWPAGSPRRSGRTPGWCWRPTATWSATPTAGRSCPGRLPLVDDGQRLPRPEATRSGGGRALYEALFDRLAARGHAPHWPVSRCRTRPASACTARSVSSRPAPTAGWAGSTAAGTTSPGTSARSTTTTDRPPRSAERGPAGTRIAGVVRALPRSSIR